MIELRSFVACTEYVHAVRVPFRVIFTLARLRAHGPASCILYRHHAHTVTYFDKTSWTESQVDATSKLGLPRLIGGRVHEHDDSRQQRIQSANQGAGQGSL